MTPCKRSSTSSMRCSRKARPRLNDAALFAEMLSLPNDGRYPALELTPQQRRQRTLEALILQVVTLSRQNPVLMIFEDAQWARPHEPRTVQSHRGQNTNAPRTAGHDVSS